MVLFFTVESSSKLTFQTVKVTEASRKEGRIDTNAEYVEECTTCTYVSQPSWPYHPYTCCGCHRSSFWKRERKTSRPFDIHAIDWIAVVKGKMRKKHVLWSSLSCRVSDNVDFMLTKLRILRGNPILKWVKQILYLLSIFNCYFHFNSTCLLRSGKDGKAGNIFFK